MEKEKKEALIKELKKRTAKKAYGIKVDDKEASFTGSRFGGYPYWEKEREYISHSSGCRMLMLAQINFEEAGLENELLPKKGILQFFIADDYLSGLDFDDQTRQDGFRIIYHDEIDPAVTEEDVKNMGIPSTMEKYEESYFPMEGQMKISFEEIEDYMGMEDERMCELVEEILDEMGYELSEDESWWDYLDDDVFDGFGHKLLGYPGFTQSDPRVFSGAMEKYGTLLLQIDSADGIMWGDAGIGNFFISEEKLKKLDFSDVLYNWDCC